MVVLETNNLNRAFGKVVVARDVTVQIHSGQMVGIVGPNGAGKTTFINMITGYIKPDQGRIVYLGEDITGLIPRQITQKGIARSFQISQLFSSMTVMENMLIALSARERKGTHIWNSIRRAEWIQEAAGILDQFGLQAYTDRPVVEMPEGGLKLLDIALSFSLRPKLLLMDEPTSGISTDNKFPIMDVLTKVLRSSGVTTIFVEHDMDVVARYADRMLVFSEGQIAADGHPTQLLEDEEVLKAMGWVRNVRT
jgi:branched-chain amino acid transport system ATP-binding protein